MPYGQGLLWRVERDGGPASYVLGTIHATDARLRRLPPEIDRAIDASRVMAFELIEGPEGAAKLNQAMLLPPGRQLEDILGTPLFRRPLDALAPLGVPAAALQGLKPWAPCISLVFPHLQVALLARGEPAPATWLQPGGVRPRQPLNLPGTTERQNKT